MAHSDWLDPIAASNPCPAPMTRAALLALRAANALRAECPYIITDHVQNRLVAGTTITLHAVSANELSEQVEVNTTYDNEAWAGIYDLDRALVLELTDNRGNVAKGINGTEVANFDWGNTAYTGCRVENATWTVTYGNPAQMLRITVHGATLITTGFTGSMQDNRIHTAANVNFTGANGLWRYSEWWGGGSFNATGYTGGGDNYYNEFNIATVNLSGLTGQATFRVNEYVGGSITATGANPITVQNCVFNGHTINRTAAGGAMNLNQCSLRGAGSIGHTGAGALNMTATQNNGTISLTGAGALTVNYCSLDQSCSIAHGGTALLSMTRTTLQGASSNVTVDAGAAAATTVNDCELRSSGIVRVVGGVGGGAFLVSNTRVESGSFIYKRHTGALTVHQSFLQGASGIDAQSGTRSYTLARCVGFEGAMFTLTGTGAVTDNLADIDARFRGRFQITCSGPANTVQYCEVGGLSGTISLSGTTGSQNVNRLKARDGSISFANCTVNVDAVLLTAEDNGAITFNGVATAKSSRYMHARANGSIIINNSTGGGTNTGITAEAGGTFVQFGTAAGASRVDIAQGQVSHNGGALQFCHKRLTGTLTTGNFNHVNIAHVMPTSRTLTVGNSNRGEYVGLAPAAYAAGGILV
jgi:hypothetical protein